MLFDPFYSTKSTGIGIGLYICRSIIERFRGHLFAMCNEGPEASFELSIPCFSREVAEA
jgi:two-component system, LuxR family, sensor kinase FixL